MIHLKLLLPVPGETLEIACEENLMADHLMDFITEIIDLPQGRRSWLCHVDKRETLKHNESLCSNGLVDGSNIIMI